MKIKKTFLALTAIIAIFSSTAFARVDSAMVVFKYLDGKASSRNIKTQRISEKLTRLILPMEEIPKNLDFLEIIADKSIIPSGSEGFWLLPRGETGSFDRENGHYRSSRCVMPLYGIKSPAETFVAIADGMKYDMSAVVRVDDKKRYKISMQWMFEDIGNAYEDIVIDFHSLPPDASYPDMAKLYRNIQVKRGAIRPIRERIKDNPTLERLSQNLLARISDFAAKEQPKNSKQADFIPEMAPPIRVLITCEEAGELLKEIKGMGMENITFVLSGWQAGGADGACPSIFPIPEEIGGETGLRKLIKLGDELAIMLSANANHTDAYTVSDMWDMDYIAKNQNGSLREVGTLFGGNMYYICIKRSWELFIKEQMQKTRNLGFKNSYYIDVYSALPPVPCFDPRHPAKRSETAKVQNEILSYAQKLFGGAASECGFDHCLGNIDYINYVSSVDFILKKYYNLDIYKGGKCEKTLVEAILPMWELVYHGFVVSTPGRVTQNHPMFGSYENTPQDMVKLAEFGARPIVYCVNKRNIKVLKKMYDFYQPLKHLQLETMEDHRKLADGVFLTLFSNGERIISNYTNHEYQFEGKKVKPLDYLLVEADKN